MFLILHLQLQHADVSPLVYIDILGDETCSFLILLPALFLVSRPDLVDSLLSLICKELFAGDRAGHRVNRLSESSSASEHILTVGTHSEPISRRIDDVVVHDLRSDGCGTISIAVTLVTNSSATVNVIDIKAALSALRDPLGLVIHMVHRF